MPLCPQRPYGRQVLGGFTAAVVFSVVLAGAALAQSASQVTPDTLAPPQTRLTGTLVFDGGSGTQAPPGADQISIVLSDVTLRGGLPDMAEADQALRTRLTRGRVPVSEIFAATADLEAAYANAGFILSRVVLPQQALQDGGTLQIEIVNGFVERLDATAVPPRIQRRIAQVTRPLIEKPGLSQKELERRLLLAGDTPGTALQSALATGEQPGGTVIVLEPEYRTVTGFIGADNLADPGLGKLTISAGVELNSALGLGETFYARLSGSQEGLFSDDPRYRVLGLGAILPLGPSGLAFNYEYTSSSTRPVDQIVPTQSSFERHAFRVTYPLIRSRAQNLTLGASLDLSKDTQDLVVPDGTTPVYDDALSVARLSADWSRTHARGAYTELSATYAQGLDAFDARSADDVGAGTPLSRAGADAEFNKLSAEGSHSRVLGPNLALTVFGAMQTSLGTPLPTSEQFSIAGSNALSAFDAGALRGDSGWVLRAEVTSNRGISLGGRLGDLNPYAFLGAGAVTLDNPTALESAKTSAQAYGLGVDLVRQEGSNFRSSFLRVEFGIGERDDGGSDGNRFSITGNFRF